MSTVKQGRSELGVALLLLLLGGWAMIDALRLPELETRGPIGPGVTAAPILVVVNRHPSSTVRVWLRIDAHPS